MATGFLLVCLLAGALVPKTLGQSATGEASHGEAAVLAAAPEGAQG